MRLFDPFLYNKVHILIVLLFSFYYCYILQRLNAQKLIFRRKGDRLFYLYVILFITVVGLRPISSAFGDTVTYARTFQYFGSSPGLIISDRDTLFYFFMWACSQFMSVNVFFLLLEVLYILPIVIACFRFLGTNADLGLVFCFAAFSFFTYGTNGLRNGVSLSLVFLALSLLYGNVFQKTICVVLSIIAIALHASAALPVTCMLLARFIKKPNVMFIFWGLSIIISLIAGNSVGVFFANLGFDDRLSEYIYADIEEDLFSHVGFRWDFLLYSAAPILFGWYVIFKKRILNNTYLLLLGTYIFANSFWIMVIRAPYSNRFAYLSWFLYPIVIAYPLLKLKIWPKSQGQKTALIMMAHLVFTLLMVFVIG